MNNIKISEYLTSKNIEYYEKNGELITKCLFNNCDKDSTGNEAHLYFNKETGQYHCKKCDAKGNLITLSKHLGDTLPSNLISPESWPQKKKRQAKTIPAKLVEKCHYSLTPEIIEYLNRRGISNEIIVKYQIGYGTFHGSWWITIPIKDPTGNYLYFKLRQDPKLGDKKWTFIGGPSQIFDWGSIITAKERVLIAEGELDALLMKSKGINCISGTAGAETFKEEWLEYFDKDLPYYICYDNDDAGRKGSKKVASLLHRNGFKDINVITLPEEVGDKGDLGDYLMRLNLPIEDLFTKYAKKYPEPIDTSAFQPITAKDIIEILEPTIKKDDVAKVITTLAMIDTFTEESQINVYFNAPSSTGKSHIPLSIAELFPPEDIITLANCSPTAFFHEQGKYNKETNEIRINLSKKILIFTDMPHPELLTRLRSFLSHDQKESKAKITDKSERGGNRTKTVVLIGFPTVIFCSAGLKIDEQESTRFIMLSPSIEQDKLIAGIKQSIQKEVNRQEFKANIDADKKRAEFKRRIEAIKQENLYDVRISDPELVEKLFLHDTSKAVKPRQQRDIKKVISLIKGFAILNMWFRKREDNHIYASREDILNAFDLWDSISVGQDYGLAPYIFKLYTDIILPLWKEKVDKATDSLTELEDKGIKRQDILKKHSEIYGRPLSMIYLRQHILPQLEQVGLIAQEKSSDNRRQMVVYPLELDIEKSEEKHSVSDSGVKTDEIINNGVEACGVDVSKINL
jgi:hypothetical protein